MRSWVVAALLGAVALGFGCTPGPVTLECVGEKDCEDGNSCTVNPCDDTASDPSSWFCGTATELPDGAACDLELGSGALDGFCNAGTCLADECTPATTDTACDDDNQCTIDSCDQSGSLNMCVNDAEGAYNDVCDFNGPGLCDGMGVCGECNLSSDCTADLDRDLCRTEVSPRVCVECLSGLDCVDDPDGENCNVVTKECDEGCTSDNDCSTEPVRDRCFLPGGGSLGSCVECLTSSDCSGDTPFCESNQCTAQPTFSGTFTLDCTALGTLPVTDIQVTVEAIPQGVPTSGQPINIVFNVVETALNFPILAAFEGCPIELLADGDEFDSTPPPLSGEVHMGAIGGGTGTVVARTVAQVLPIVNPLAIPDLATGTATFTPEAGASSLSIGLDTITMHLVAPLNAQCGGRLLTPVVCPIPETAPSGTIEIPIEPAP